MIPQSVIFTLRKINLHLNSNWTSNFEISCSIALDFLFICIFIVCLGRIEPTCCYKWNSSWEILPSPTQSLFSPRKLLLCRYLQRTSVNPTVTSSMAKARQQVDFAPIGLLLCLSSGKKHYELPHSTLLTKGTEACVTQRSETPLHPQGFGEEHSCIEGCLCVQAHCGGRERSMCYIGRCEIWRRRREMGFLHRASFNRILWLVLLSACQRLKYYG